MLAAPPSLTARWGCTGDVWRAKLWLVDLAGSERLDKSAIDQGPSAGRRLQEAQFINKSLASLGDCIHALSSRAPHVPFRNSKLTYMLQVGLGMRCTTAGQLQLMTGACTTTCACLHLAASGWVLQLAGARCSMVECM